MTTISRIQPSYAPTPERTGRKLPARADDTRPRPAARPASGKGSSGLIVYTASLQVEREESQATPFPQTSNSDNGGGSGDNQSPDVVVVGRRDTPDTSNDSSPGLSPGIVGHGQRPAPTEEPIQSEDNPPPTPLADRIVTVAIDDPTPDEQRVIGILKRRINHNDKIMPKLKDEMTLTAPLSDGSTNEVTGKEVQGLWSAMKIQIDPKGTPYPNGTGSGASTDANGVTHFAVDTLQDYMRPNYSDNENDSRADYLLFHEIAHNTQAGKAENSWECEHGQKDEKKYYPDNEKFSNSLARSIEKVIGDTPVKNPSYDYDSSFPDFSGGSPSTTSSTSADSSPAPSPSQTTLTNEDSPKAGTPDEKGPKGSFRGSPDHNQIP